MLKENSVILDDNNNETGSETEQSTDKPTGSDAAETKQKPVSKTTSEDLNQNSRIAEAMKLQAEMQDAKLAALKEKVDFIVTAEALKIGKSFDSNFDQITRLLIKAGNKQLSKHD